LVIDDLLQYIAGRMHSASGWPAGLDNDNVRELLLLLLLLLLQHVLHLDGCQLMILKPSRAQQCVN
jgi:hypothetical protein